MLLSFLPLLLSTVLVKTTGLERNGAYFGFHNKQEIQHQNSEIEKSLKIQSHFSQTQGSISVSKKNDDTESSASFTFVEIKLKLSDAINPTDALGLWCEESDELVDFITLDEGLKGETTVSIGDNVATINTKLHHMRCTLYLQYLVNGMAPIDTIKYALHGILDRPASTPYHLRVAYGPSPQTSIWLSWTQDANTTRPFVRIGLESNQYTTTVYASNTTSNTGGPYYDTYYPEDLCGRPANITSVLYYMWPGYFANVLLTHLLPSTKYYAVYGSEESSLSKETSFTTGKAVSPDTPVRIASFGDMALSVQGAMSTVHHIVQLFEEQEDGVATSTEGIDAVIHFGDLGYAEGSTVLWDIWHSYIEKASRQIPYLVSVGNHEVDHATMSCYQDPSNDAGADGTGFHPSLGSWSDDSNGEGGVPIYHRFKSPACTDIDAIESVGSGALNALDGKEMKGMMEMKSSSSSTVGNAIFWYSFALGSVYVIQLSSEHNFTSGSQQYEWLVNELEQIDRSVSPWLVITLHRPMMSPEAGYAFDEGIFIQANLEDLFLQYEVDLVLGGHAHVYERMCSMNHLMCTSTTRRSSYDSSPSSRVEESQRGITYIVVGSAGATVHNETLVKEADKWLLDWRVEWGFGVITAVNRSALKWEFYSNSKGIVVDDVWLVK